VLEILDDSSPDGVVQLVGGFLGEGCVSVSVVDFLLVRVWGKPLGKSWLLAWVYLDLMGSYYCWDNTSRKIFTRKASFYKASAMVYNNKLLLIKEGFHFFQTFLDRSHPILLI
jgi:hypothetical protein